MINDLPNFPSSRPFTINDINWYYEYYIKHGFNPYVDIHPDNLYVWLNFHNDLMISNIGGAVILCYTNILDNNKFNIIPLANPLTESILEQIMSYLKVNNLSSEIGEIPSIICSKLDQSKWQIDDDRDSYEYILDTSQQSLLEGKKFYKRRMHLNIFERKHSNDIVDIKYYREFDDQIKEAFYQYINTMPFNSTESSSQKNVVEPITIRKNLEYASIFRKKALIIRINGKIASMAMVSYIDDNTAAFNHLKVDYSIEYIFRYTIHQLAKTLRQEGIKEINIEQDLGISGLRTFKEHLLPSRLLEKKIIRPRHQ